MYICTYMYLCIGAATTGTPPPLAPPQTHSLSMRPRSSTHTHKHGPEKSERLPEQKINRHGPEQSERRPIPPSNDGMPNSLNPNKGLIASVWSPRAETRLSMTSLTTNLLGGLTPRSRPGHGLNRRSGLDRDADRDHHSSGSITHVCVCVLYVRVCVCACV
jgi:hypothetical protein